MKDRRPVIASCIYMGLGQIVFQKQYIKGAFFALAETAALFFSGTIVGLIAGLVTLGEARPDLPIRERPNSTFMLVEGLLAVTLVLVLLLLYAFNVADARRTQKNFEKTGSYPTQRQVASSLADRSFTVLGLSPVLVMLLFFVVVPLLYTSLIAFTDYSSPSNIPPANVINWSGLNTFRELFGLTMWSNAFARVAIWTIAWATMSTATCYMGGMLMALALLNRRIKVPQLFRSIFVLPYAIPGVLSLLVWRNLLNGQFGPVNRLLLQLNVISNTIPWLTDVWLARMSLILVNLWLGFPYFMMLTTGVMTSIAPELQEAAQIDGANNWQRFRKVTFPLIVYQTIPLFIMSFSYNLNNFGGVYFLTQGNPTDLTTTQSGAGATDILMSWMYKLTYELRIYNKAAVLAILVFVVVAPFAVYNLTRTKAFKEGEL